jgi:hypothetical protein
LTELRRELYSLPSGPIVVPTPDLVPAAQLTNTAKVALFRSLFRGREDVFFAGVPKRVVYDNLKSVVLHRVGATVQFNPRFLAFAGHYLFEPVAAPVRYPEYKGGVEAVMKYVRHSFWCGRTFSSLDDVRNQAARWCDFVADERLHATTRERPAARLLVERPTLRALPPRPFDTDIVMPLIVSKEVRVCCDTNTCSVPPELVGKTVILRADDRRVRIFYDAVEVAAHGRCWNRRRHIEDPAHLAKLLERRKGARPQAAPASPAALPRGPLLPPGGRPPPHPPLARGPEAAAARRYVR